MRNLRPYGSMNLVNKMNPRASGACSGHILGHDHMCFCQVKWNRHVPGIFDKEYLKWKFLLEVLFIRLTRPILSPSSKRRWVPSQICLGSQTNMTAVSVDFVSLRSKFLMMTLRRKRFWIILSMTGALWPVLKLRRWSRDNDETLYWEYSVWK